MSLLSKVLDKALDKAGLGRVVNRPEVASLYKRDHPTETDRGSESDNRH